MIESENFIISLYDSCWNKDDLESDTWRRFLVDHKTTSSCKTSAIKITKAEIKELIINLKTIVGD